jgi:hypothetical protein
MDLSGKTMEELREMDGRIVSQLNALDLSTLATGFTQDKSDRAQELLADRRQIQEKIREILYAYGDQLKG